MNSEIANKIYDIIKNDVGSKKKSLMRINKSDIIDYLLSELKNNKRIDIDNKSIIRESSTKISSLRKTITEKEKIINAFKDKNQKIKNYIEAIKTVEFPHIPGSHWDNYDQYTNHIYNEGDIGYDKKDINCNYDSEDAFFLSLKLILLEIKNNEY